MYDMCVCVYSVGMSVWYVCMIAVCMFGVCSVGVYMFMCGQNVSTPVYCMGSPPAWHLAVAVARLCCPWPAGLPCDFTQCLEL